MRFLIRDSQITIQERARAFFYSLLFTCVIGYLATFFSESATGRFLNSIALSGLMFFAVVFSLKALKESTHRRRFQRLLQNLSEAGEEKEIQNFIERFGRIKDPGELCFSHRGYNFEENRVSDLLDFLQRKGIRLGQEELFAILRRYIDDKERRVTFESVKQGTMNFRQLDPTGFELLLKRLFEQMGYAAQHTGKRGDQGGDLVAARNGDRILVQAKRYLQTRVGNEAVQEAVAATRFYGCSRAMVMTTGEFTPEAIALAKANSVELIPGTQLRGMLHEHLHESWA